MLNPGNLGWLLLILQDTLIEDLLQAAFPLPISSFLVPDSYLAPHVSVYPQKTVSYLSRCILLLVFLLLWAELVPVNFMQKPGDKHNCWPHTGTLTICSDSLSSSGPPPPPHPISQEHNQNFNSLVAIPFNLAAFSHTDFSYNKDWFLNNSLLCMYFSKKSKFHSLWLFIFN